MSINANGAQRQPIVWTYGSAAQIHPQQQAAARASTAPFQSTHQAFQNSPPNMGNRNFTQVPNNTPRAVQMQNIARNAAPFIAADPYMPIPSSPTSSHENPYARLPIFPNKGSEYSDIFAVHDAQSAEPTSAYSSIPSPSQLLERHLQDTLDKFKNKSAEQFTQKGITSRSTLETFAKQIKALDAEIAQLPPDQQAGPKKLLQECRSALKETLLKEFPSSGNDRSSVISKYAHILSNLMQTAGISDARLNFRISTLNAQAQGANIQEIADLKQHTKSLASPIGEMMIREQKGKKVEQTIRLFDKKIFPKLMKMNALQSSSILNLLLRQKLSPKLRAHIEAKTLQIMEVRYQSIFKKMQAGLQNDPSPTHKANIRKQISTLMHYAEELNLSAASKKQLQLMFKKYSDSVVKFRTS